MSVLMTILSITEYVLMAVGLARIAARRGISNTWFAWIPILKLSLLGSVSDQYQYDTKKVQKHKGRILPLLTLVPAVLVVILIAVAGGTGDLDFAGAVFVLNLFVGATLGITSVVMYYMALRDLYLSCSPEQATLYTVISVILPVTTAVFVFCLREKGTDAVRDPGYTERTSGTPVREKAEAFTVSVKDKIRNAGINGVRCPGCGAFVQGEKTICPFCGFRFSDTAAAASEPAENVAGGEHCPHCGEAIAEDDLFCPGCGRPITRLETMKTYAAGRNCPYCGEPLTGDDLFCPGCGRSLKDTDAEKKAGGAFTPAEVFTEKSAMTVKTKRVSCPEEKANDSPVKLPEKKLIIRRSSEKSNQEIFKKPDF